MSSQPILVALNDDIHNRVVEMLEGEMRGNALDVGCGDGTLTQRLSDVGFSARGVDRFPGDFRPKLPIDVADLNESLPYEDGMFDVVVSTEVIEHVENPWFFVREMHRITRPGGVVIVSTPNLDSIYVRLYFALTGKLYNFGEATYREIGHITPIFYWNLERMVSGIFDIEDTKVNASPVPKLHWRIPLRHRLIGQCIVVKLRKVGDHATSRRWDQSRILRSDG